MTRTHHRLISGAVAAAAIAWLGAGQALAQPTNNSDNREPWRNPAQGEPTPKPKATSSLAATQAAAQDDHQSRALAAAIFARPSAAQKAANKVSAANASKITPADPKPEWVNEQGVRFGGEGLEVSKPF
ncbi:MAG: hypothetical protein JSR98_03655 [Proteobacteria bacterium]|nr:hypothetical protein [Pseudomonadota bacterium]